MRRVLSLFLTLLVLALGAGAQAPQSVGKVDRMIPAGFIARGSSTNEAKKADPVEWNDILRTNEQGRMRIALDDGSQLSIGGRSELRVVKHDPQSSQTVVEMLYGKTRATVVPIKKSGGTFQVRTPTAVIGVLGTTVDVETVQLVGTVSEKEIQNLPASRRSVADLVNLVPGVLPDRSRPDQATIADYLIDGTRVRALDHTVAVRSIDPEILKTVVVLPGYETYVPRGGPPSDPKPFLDPDQPQQITGPNKPFTADDCPGYIDPRMFDLFPEGKRPSYEIVGRGTSTGQVFEIRITNPTNCPLNVQIPAGSILEPKGYVGRVLKGILLGGGMPPLKDFQTMQAEGGFLEAPAFDFNPVPDRPRFNFFVPPESDEVVGIIRGYCLDLHKLAPHAKTKYKFADAADQKKLSAPNLKVIEAANKMFFNRQIASQIHSLDNIVQWSLWASREKMDAKKFREEFFDLVKKNYEGQKKKFDKDAKASTDRMAKDLWDAVEKVLAATR